MTPLYKRAEDALLFVATTAVLIHFAIGARTEWGAFWLLWLAFLNACQVVTVVLDTISAVLDRRIDTLREDIGRD